MHDIQFFFNEQNKISEVFIMTKSQISKKMKRYLFIRLQIQTKNMSQKIINRYLNLYLKIKIFIDSRINLSLKFSYTHFLLLFNLQNPIFFYDFYQNIILIFYLFIIINNIFVKNISQPNSQMSSNKYEKHTTHINHHSTKRSNLEELKAVLPKSKVLVNNKNNSNLNNINMVCNNRSDKQNTFGNMAIVMDYFKKQNKSRSNNKCNNQTLNTQSSLKATNQQPIHAAIKKTNSNNIGNNNSNKLTNIQNNQQNDGNSSKKKIIGTKTQYVGDTILISKKQDFNKTMVNNKEDFNATTTNVQIKKLLNLNNQSNEKSSFKNAYKKPNGQNKYFLTADVSNVLRAIKLSNNNDNSSLLKNISKNLKKQVINTNQNQNGMTQQDIQKLFEKNNGSNQNRNQSSQHESVSDDEIEDSPQLLLNQNIQKVDNITSKILDITKRKENKLKQPNQNSQKLIKKKPQNMLASTKFNNIVVLNGQDCFQNTKQLFKKDYYDCYQLEDSIVPDRKIQTMKLDIKKIMQDDQQIKNNDKFKKNLAQSIKFLQITEQQTKDKLLAALKQDQNLIKIQPDPNTDKTVKFKEEFIVGKQIGEGAYASVRVAIYKPENKKVAIKVYQKKKIKQIQRRKSVKREIKILQKINHKNIVKIYDVIQTNNHVNIIMQYVSGISLNCFLKSQAQNKVCEKDAKKIFIALVDALKYLHSLEICHRDIKLQNILLDSKLCPKLIDFGFSTCIQNQKKIKMFCGTPSYMAPQIVQKKQYKGTSADIWALGVLLYVMFTGIFPFKGNTDKELYTKISNADYPKLTGVSKAAINLIQRMLTIDPDQRITSQQILQHFWITGKQIKNGLQKSLKNGQYSEQNQKFDLIMRMHNNNYVRTSAQKYKYLTQLCYDQSKQRIGMAQTHKQQKLLRNELRRAKQQNFGSPDINLKPKTCTNRDSVKMKFDFQGQNTRQISKEKNLRYLFDNQKSQLKRKGTDYIAKEEVLVEKLTNKPYF